MELLAALALKELLFYFSFFVINVMILHTVIIDQYSHNYGANTVQSNTMHYALFTMQYTLYSMHCIHYTICAIYNIV